ncbi:MAG: class II glutamine amidotransferase [Chromatiaceae bacterium]|nr:MAG: class II glutamine amidotransferase [Chromatiaceae bacterium]
MCELFAMSSRVPATLGFSLERLARHGGDEGPHRDGWGLAFYEGPDCLLLREPHPACKSPLMQFMERQGLRTRMAVSHIRLATFGERSLRNTQPFSRELGGHMHVFAHNGDLPALAAAAAVVNPVVTPVAAAIADSVLVPVTAGSRFRPIGDSDSERAFCGLLTRLTPLWDAAAGTVPALSARLALLADYARELRRLGSANFIYADGDALFVHADRRTQADGCLRAPGLYLLQRCCWRAAPELAEAGVRLKSIRQDVALVASVPLTDERWQPLGEGDLIALSQGLCFGADGRPVNPEQLDRGSVLAPVASATVVGSGMRSGAG